MNYNWDWGVFFKSTGIGNEIYLDWFVTGLGWTIAIALAISVLKDIADEERVHAGEFLRLLHALEPEEAKFYAEGAAEVEEEIEKLGK